NEEKSSWLHGEFFPQGMAASSVPLDAVYPPPAWEWKPMTDDVLHLAVEKMKFFKATFPGSAPNCVMKICTELLLPFIGPIYRSLDELRHYPADWAELRIPVMRKPGKASYTEPGAHRPIALSKGFARWLNGAKDIQQVSEAELAGILPRNQYG
ncbi:hypothetical protein DFH08DRAFT_627428, partial [Mycena albidolilacea]